jgi:GDPmannose 4,6-dehydratase
MAFSLVGLDYRKYVAVDPNLFRPAEVDLLIGNPAMATQKLGWTRQTDFPGLVREMIESDCRAFGVDSAALKIYA